MKKFLIPALALCLVAGIFISKQFGTDKETTVTEQETISEQVATTEEAPAVVKDAGTEQVATEQVATTAETPAAEVVATAEDKAKPTDEAPAVVEEKAATAEKAPAATEDKTATAEKTPAVSDGKATPEKAPAPVAKAPAKAPEKTPVAKAPAKAPAPVAKAPAKAPAVAKAPAKAPAPVAKAPAKAPVPVAKAPAPVAQKSSAHPNKDEANSTLRIFANSALEKMNRLVIPSKGKKEIRQNGNGTWTARYTEIDLNSLQTSVAVPADTKFVQYIGYMRYVDVEYICTADSKQAALNGPFKVNSKESLTELVKCQKGKWGY